MEEKQTLNSGAAAAAILAAGIGSFAFGLAVCLAQAAKPVANFLVFSASVGPLSGKTGVGIAVWLISWFILAAMWKNRQVNFARVFAISLLLIVLGIVGTFPPFYDMF